MHLWFRLEKAENIGICVPWGHVTTIFLKGLLYFFVKEVNEKLPRVYKEDLLLQCRIWEILQRTFIPSKSGLQQLYGSECKNPEDPPQRSNYFHHPFCRHEHEWKKDLEKQDSTRVFLNHENMSEWEMRVPNFVFCALKSLKKKCTVALFTSNAPVVSIS